MKNKILFVTCLVVILNCMGCGNTEKDVKENNQETSSSIETQELVVSEGNSSRYNNELYFEICVNNVETSQGIEAYITPEVSVDGVPCSNYSGYSPTINEDEGTVVFPYIVRLEQSPQKEELCVEADISKIFINEEISGDWKLTFYPEIDESVEEYDIATEISCSDGTEITIDKLVQGVYGASLKCKFTFEEESGSEALYYFEGRDENGTEYTFYYEYTDGEITNMGCYQKVENDTVQKCSLPNGIEKLYLTCYKLDVDNPSDEKCVSKEIEIGRD